MYGEAMNQQKVIKQINKHIHLDKVSATKARGSYLLMIATHSEKKIFDGEDDDTGELKKVEGKIVTIGKDLRDIVWELPKSKHDFLEAIEKWTWLNCDDDGEEDDDSDRDPINFDSMHGDGLEVKESYLEDGEGQQYYEWEGDTKVETETEWNASYGPSAIELFFDDKNSILFDYDNNDSYVLKVGKKTIAKKISDIELAEFIPKLLL